MYTALPVEIEALEGLCLIHDALQGRWPGKGAEDVERCGNEKILVYLLNEDGNGIAI